MPNGIQDLTRALQDRSIDRRMFLQGAFALGLSIPSALAILEACGSAGGGATKGTLVIDTGQLTSINSLDPALSGFVIDQFTHLQVYQSLLRFNDKDLTKSYPSLASSYTVSSDGLTYTFTLQKGAVFSDGTPVTADDVVFSINRNRNLKGNGQFIPDNLTVAAVDSQTVKLMVPTPNISIPWYVAQVDTAILNSTVLKQHGGTDGSTPDNSAAFINQNSVGSGPYMFESVDPWQQVVLKTNPKYWGPGPKPTYQRAIIRQTAAATQSLDIQKGDAQIALDLTNAQASALSGNIDLHAGTSHFILYFGLNADPAISTVTSNPGFREAVAYGVDYDGFLQIVKPAIRLGGYAPPSYLGGLPSSAAITRDVTRAKAALASAGLTNPTVTLSYPSDNPEGIDMVTLATKVQADLQEVGITVQLDGSPIAVLAGPYHAGKTAFILFEDAIDFPDPVMVLDFGPDAHFGARMHWHIGQNPTTDALVTAATSAVDPQQRATAYRGAINLDIHVIIGVALFVAVVYVATNLAVDLLYAWIDPRIRLIGEPQQSGSSARAGTSE